MKLTVTALKSEKLNLSTIFYQAMMKMIEELDFQLEKYEVVYLEEPLIEDFPWEIKFSHRNFEYNISTKEEFDKVRNSPYSGMVYTLVFEYDIPVEDGKSQGVVIYTSCNMS